MDSKDEFKQNFQQFLRDQVLETRGQRHSSAKRVRYIWEKAGELGFLGNCISPNFGGKGDLQYSVILQQQLGYSCVLDFPFWLHDDVVGGLIQKYAREEIKSKYLQDMVFGRRIGALAITEDTGGSNIAQLQTTIKERDGQLTLNGKKSFISNAAIADFFLVFGKMDGTKKNNVLVLIDKHNSGVEVCPFETQSAMFSLNMGNVVFTNAYIDDSAMLQMGSDALLPTIKALTIERLIGAYISSCSNETLLKYALSYLKTRKTGGVRLQDCQALSHKVAKMVGACRTNSVFVSRLIEKYVNHQRLSFQDVAIAKYQCVNLLEDLSLMLIKLMGASALIQEESSSLNLYQLHSDAIAQSIAGGTEEIMLKIIAETM